MDVLHGFSTPEFYDTLDLRISHVYFLRLMATHICNCCLETESFGFFSLSELLDVSGFFPRLLHIPVLNIAP